MGELASAGFDGYPVLATDSARRSVLYFASDRGGAIGIWTSVSPWSIAPFDAPTPAFGLYEPDAEDLPGWVSADACRLYFTRVQGRSPRIWMAER